MSKNITVLSVEPDKLPEVITIKNDLKSKQDYVGGLIEYVSLPDDDNVLLICNEEGKIDGLPVNRDIGYDIICGKFLIVGNPPDAGCDVSLTEEQIKKYQKVFDEDSIDKAFSKLIDIARQQMLSKMDNSI